MQDAHVNKYLLIKLPTPVFSPLQSIFELIETMGQMLQKYTKHCCLLITVNIRKLVSVPDDPQKHVDFKTDQALSITLLPCYREVLVSCYGNSIVRDVTFAVLHRQQ